MRPSDVTCRTAIASRRPYIARHRLGKTEVMLDYINHCSQRINAEMDKLLFAPLAFVVVLGLSIAGTAVFEHNTGEAAASRLILQADG